MLKRITKWMYFGMLMVILMVALAGCQGGSETGGPANNGQGASPSEQGQESQNLPPDEGDPSSSPEEDEGGKPPRTLLRMR